MRKRMLKRCPTGVEDFSDEDFPEIQPQQQPEPEPQTTSSPQPDTMDDDGLAVNDDDEVVNIEQSGIVENEDAEGNGRFVPVDIPE